VYKLTRKGEEYRRSVNSSMRRGWTPTVKARVLLDIGSGRQPLKAVLTEARWYGEKGLTEYLYGLESLENDGFIEEVEE